MVALQALWSPVRAMEAAARERRVALGCGVVASWAVLRLIIFSAILLIVGSATSQYYLQTFPETITFQVSLLIFSVLWPFTLWVLITLVMQLVTGFFGGSGPLSAMFAATGVAYVPFAIGDVINIPLTGVLAVVDPQSAAAVLLELLSLLLTIVFLIWHVALVIVGASFAREVSYGQSGGSCAISCAGCGGLILAVSVALVLIGVALGSGG